MALRGSKSCPTFSIPVNVFFASIHPSKFMLYATLVQGSVLGICGDLNSLGTALWVLKVQLNRHIY